MKKRLIIMSMIWLLINLYSFEQVAPDATFGFCIDIDEVTGFTYVTSIKDQTYKINLETNEWLKLNTGIVYPDRISDIEAYNDVIFVVSKENFRVSRDGGITWDSAHQNLPLFINGGDKIIRLTSDENIIFAKLGINMWFRSNDNGFTWSEPIISASPSIASVNNDSLLIMLEEGTVLKSFDLGVTWTETSNYIDQLHQDVYDFVALDDNQILFSGINIISGKTNIKKYNIEENSLTSVQSNLLDYVTRILKLPDNNIFISFMHNYNESEHYGIMKLNEDNTLSHLFIDPDKNSGFDMVYYNDNIYLISRLTGVIKYDLINLGTDIFYPDSYNNEIVNGATFGFASETNDDIIAIKSNLNLFTKENDSSNWIRHTNMYKFLGFSKSPFNSNLYFGTSMYKGLFKSTDNCETFIPSNTGIAEEHLFYIGRPHFINENKILIKCSIPRETPFYPSEFVIYESVDQGNSWVQNESLNQMNIQRSFFYDNIAYFLCNDNQIFKVNSLNESWELLHVFDNFKILKFFKQNSGNFYTIGYDISTSPSVYKIWQSNNGIDWVELISTNDFTWSPVDLKENPQNSNQLFVCGFNPTDLSSGCPHLYISEDNGQNWNPFYFEELPSEQHLNELFIKNNMMYIAPLFGGIYEVEMSDFVNYENYSIPVNQAIHLSNYPNPFNPSTTITFTIPESGNVKIEIYNIKGQKIKTLVDAYFETKKASVQWNGDDDNGKKVTSGQYFAKLISGDFVISKKMLILK